MIEDFTNAVRIAIGRALEAQKQLHGSDAPAGALADAIAEVIDVVRSWAGVVSPNEATLASVERRALDAMLAWGKARDDAETMLTAARAALAKLQEVRR